MHKRHVVQLYAFEKSLIVIRSNDRQAGIPMKLDLKKAV